MAVIRIETDKIVDEASFHGMFKEAFGFPDFYGNNMDAWIDCMSSLTVDDGLTTVNLDPKESAILEITKTEDFNNRLPKVFDSLIECSAFVNKRYAEENEDTRILLLFI